MNYEHFLTGEVISESAYQNLSREKQLEYHSTYRHPQSDDNDESLISTAVEVGLGLAIGTMLDNHDDGIMTPDVDTGSIFGDFGGGDSGGAGAGGEW
jgi:hypothetical protein